MSHTIRCPHCGGVVELALRTAREDSLERTTVTITVDVPRTFADRINAGHVDLEPITDEFRAELASRALNATGREPLIPLASVKPIESYGPDEPGRPYQCPKCFSYGGWHTTTCPYSAMPR